MQTPEPLRFHLFSLLFSPPFVWTSRHPDI
jgi:hypothetical protein